MTTEEKIQQTFPFVLNNVTYYLRKVSRDQNNVPHIEYCDNENYKYYSNWRIFQYNALKKNKVPSRFFSNNKYTKENINNFLLLNNVPLTLVDDIPLINGANTKYKYLDSNGRIHQIKWNAIKSNPKRFSIHFLSCSNLKFTKEEVIGEIFKLQEKLQRPLVERDFRINTGSFITQRDISRHFGSFENMQHELGYLTARERERTFLTFEQCLDEIKYVCNEVLKHENRTVIRSFDFKKYSRIGKDSHLFADYCRRNNTTLAKAVNSLGCGYQMSSKGMGLNYEFEDGEITYSSLEYDFSLFLRNNNIAYKREVLYSSFIPNYIGHMNCDYVLTINNNKIYVELAGMIDGNDEFKYLNNEYCGSKIIDQYFDKMRLKEKLLSENHCDYYILLRSQIHEKMFNEIIH